MALQVVKPRIRGFICTSAHPIGCHENVKNQIDYIKKNITSNGENPNVLVIGASRGYGPSRENAGRYWERTTAVTESIWRIPTRRSTRRRWRPSTRPAGRGSSRP